MASRSYNPQEIEPRWQQYWDEKGIFQAREDSHKPKFYCLVMYPYPSGTLHVGHPLNYTLGDAVVRYRVKRGYNVLSPMGWDAFGLPAENAAIRENVPPAKFTRANIERMRQQIKRAGWGYDWSRELSTADPTYYRWTQWLFLQFYKQGIAFRKLAPVNWCPTCRTVLANEQVHSGECERCSTPVEQRDLEQWFFKMSAYAQRLLDNHKKLKRWPERVIRMQEEWIGRSEGARVDFTIAETGEKLPIFTTRPDTLFGVTFMSLAPEHLLVEKLIKGTNHEDEVMQTVRKMRQLGTAERERVELEKMGVDTGFHAINPVNGEKVPIWVVNFVLMAYGTGAVMAVPAHDQRDFEFARQFGLPIRVVIQPEDEELNPDTMLAAYVEDGVQVNSAQFDGMGNRQAKQAIVDWLAQEGKAEAAVTYRLRDWLISRQRYWGAPIPIVYCKDCGEVPVLEEDLPVLLPEEVVFKPTGDSPLSSCEEFVNITCPQCGGAAKRETDTMDTFVDSSWYFLRYCSPRDDRQAFSPDRVHFWMPVDQYIGGIEHATMHLIYCRFFTMVLNDLGLLDFDEPAQRLFCQGMLCKEAHYCPQCRWIPDELVEGDTCKTCGSTVTHEMAKISKSKLNVVSPDEIIARQGADALRLYLLSDAPPDRDQVWSDEGLAGSYRFLMRLWEVVETWQNTLAEVEAFQGPADEVPERLRTLHRLTHQVIKKLTEDLEGRFQFNTGIARIMELLSATRTVLNQGELSPEELAVVKESLEATVQLLSVLTPHIAEELWVKLGHEPSIMETPWPEFDEEAIQADEVEIIVQVNGKLRSRLTVPRGLAKEELESRSLAEEHIQEILAGKSPLRVVVVPDRLVNIVLGK